MYNLPNALTVLRIALIFIFLILGSNAGEVGAEPVGWVLGIRVTALVLAIIAGVTDLLDGYLARKWNQVTDFGALMDPLADKIFVTATMLIAIEYRLMPAWIAAMVIAREFMVTGLRTLGAKAGTVIAADRWGKLKTALQMLMLALAGASWIGCFDLRTKYTWQWYVWIIYLCGIVAVTMISGGGYFFRYRHLFLSKRA